MTRGAGAIPGEGEDFNSHARVGRDLMDTEMQKKTPNFNSHARVGRDDATLFLH